MDLRETIAEVVGLLDALLDAPKCNPKLSRAHALASQALGSFFGSEQDVADLAPDEEPPW